MNIVLTTGFLVMLTPYLGLPSMWETGILVFLGFLIVVRALYLKKIFKDIKKTKGNSESSSFKQNE
ncbi:hypothetical protein A2442_00685 [Candidatus Campbellbacteria bacterium RIFOXYC2_FULL_35_25]|uniref:Uncharacterized protein n=1 Tax=Candidatus Campbellbacteria bacterium RIFOXYC2_FULL_35_25 TaxID=1797582 RepID=A0A1F5EJ86_9BACT|nr:MAG: hypothetical protein A2442_00685 [Candidatus Campbellbacteria bacterium RIFOXYC2_FULL_35_25]